MRQARIVGTGHYVPDRVLTNNDVVAMMPTSNEWIVAKTGILERRIAEADQCTSDLAVEAARRALNAAEILPDEVDLILLSTSTPDYPLPATAAIVQDKLGAKKAVGFDLNAVCSGFIYGLTAADAYIKAGTARTVLLIAAENYTKIVDWQDRRTSPFFGDGAGAVVLRADTDGYGILAHHAEMDGSGTQTIVVPAGGTRNPISKHAIERHDHLFHMDGHAVWEFAVDKWPTSVRQVLDMAGLTLDDVSLLIPHQANLRIIEQGAAALGFPMERVQVTVDRYGNTASSTIPMALDVAVRQGKVRRGDNIVMVAFGGGLAWGSVVVRW